MASILNPGALLDFSLALALSSDDFGPNITAILQASDARANLIVNYWQFGPDHPNTVVAQEMLRDAMLELRTVLLGPDEVQ